MRVFPKEQFWETSFFKFILTTCLMASSKVYSKKKSNPKLFSYGTALLSVIHNVNLSQIDLNEYLDRINNWAYQRKMSFNPDSSKKNQKVIFIQKVNNVLHPPSTFLSNYYFFPFYKIFYSNTNTNTIFLVINKKKKEKKKAA